MFPKRVEENYRNVVSGASPMVAEDLDSRSLALQKMDRKDHSRPPTKIRMAQDFKYQKGSSGG